MKSIDTYSSELPPEREHDDRQCACCGKEADEIECSVELADGTIWCEACANQDCEHERDIPEENPRERGDDDGVEYADPRDEMDDRWLSDL